jgi:uncharacterized membrane protein
VDSRKASPYLLAAVVGGSGALHLLSPGFYERLVPPFLGSPRAWVYASGFVELDCAAALAWLPLQVPLVLWALRVWRSARKRP